MNITIREYSEKDVEEMINIWNEIVIEGKAFPQIDELGEPEGKIFFGEQSYCGVAENADSGEILGLYILHPNNIGRCGHISNASYAVKGTMRGQHIGEKLVSDCLLKAAELGFRILQFNAVVKTNTGARHLYEKLGFIQLGEIKDGFLMKDGSYEDIIPYYKTLTSKPI